ncbi:uncharacterized protein LOC113560967 [Rhopalosiphum maidis]|uniref:uncharacterized protein LOC113560967 n=1 Tax=Rhopalosiphum maidis TaxID=43146 RepID=UPI000F00D246|nr:uncharacterized protein LOC113560967 [Rhopalosiphum maidis]
MLFTVVVTFVWVRSDRLTVKDSVHQTTSSEQKWVWTSTPVAIQEPTGERAPRHRPHAEQSGVTMRSQNSDVFQDYRLEIGPSMSENRTPLLIIRGKLIKKIPYSTYHRGGNTRTSVDENLNISDTSRILHKMNIRLNHRQINNYDYPNIQIDEPIANKEVLTNNPNAYDLTYDVSGKGSEENKNSIDSISWITFFNRSGQIIPRRLWLLKTPEKSGSLDQPPFGLRTHSQNIKDLKYRLTHDVNKVHKIPERQLMKSFSLTNEFDFKTQPIQQDSLILQPPSIPNVENNISSSPQKTIIKIPLINERICQTENNWFHKNLISYSV